MSVWDEIRKICKFYVQGNPKNNTHRHKQVSDAKLQRLEARNKEAGKQEDYEASGIRID